MKINVTVGSTTYNGVETISVGGKTLGLATAFESGDDNKVVQSGALQAQTSKNVNANGTVDTTTNNQVVVSVPNSYAAGDEGKVVSSGALVSQGSDTVTENGTVDTTLINSLTVNVPTGSVSVPPSDVNFIDYDGTILHAYTAAAFADLTALPANPSHAGLTAQGWNWTLAEAKAYVAAYGKLWIGQMYVTTSGDTEIDIELHAPRLSPYLGIAVNGTVEIDWGDDTQESAVAGTSLETQIRTLHEYAAEGKYTIKIHVVSGEFAPYGASKNSVLSGGFNDENKNSAYANAVQAVRIGTGVTSISDYAFNYCYSISAVTIPSSVTSIGAYAFGRCYSIPSLTIPSGVTSIGNYAFVQCCAMLSISLPGSVTGIGNYAFNYGYALPSVTLPGSMTSISDYMFRTCSSLTSVTIPSGVTSFGSYALGNCTSLASVIIPSSVTSIGTYAFNGCYGLGSIIFKPTTPPSVSNSNAFGNMSTDCKIIVPYSADHSVLAAYKAASNYPDDEVYTYEEAAQ